MNINQLFDRDTYTYTYIVSDNKNNAVIIDPVLEQFDRDTALIESLGFKIKLIIETHVHADHITSAYLLKKKFNSKIAYGENNKIEGADMFLKDDEVLSIGNLKFKVIHSPGHTAGCISIYIKGYVCRILYLLKEQEELIFKADHPALLKVLRKIIQSS